MPLRVLVVDDTAIYRKIVSEALREMPDVEVVGTAIDGRIALEKIHEMKPDLVTLDLEMPHLNGVEVLRHLRERGSEIGVIMLSAHTSQSAAATTEALQLGAFDFVLKPEGANPTASGQLLREKLAQRVAAFRESRGIRVAKKTLPAPPRVRQVKSLVTEPTRFDIPPGDGVDVIVLAVSTGGPEALSKLIPQLPGDLACPLFIVQHMPPLFTKSLADDLNRRSPLRVYEAGEGQLARPGDCLVAPGGKQMKIERTEDGPVARLTDDPPENSCRPAADYLFRSAAHEYGGRVLAVVLTGMGSDGALGCRLLKRRGANVIAQNRETCVVFGMPGAVVEQGLADEVVPLEEIASRIVAHLPQGTHA